MLISQFKYHSRGEFGCLCKNNPNYEKVCTTEGMLMHSDQGWHYQHAAYQRSLKNHHIIQSMSRRGNCLDNSVMENFFGIMKSELLYAKKYTSMDSFITD